MGHLFNQYSNFLKILLYLWFMCVRTSLASTIRNQSVPSLPFPIYQNISHTSYPLYYLTTDEGLLSHYRQLDIVWNQAKLFNRSIIALAFNSTHYPDVTHISMCDIFRLPPEIKCSKLTPDVIINQYQCIYTGLIHPSDKYYRIPLRTNSNFSYENEQCIAGAVNTDVGYPPLITRRIMMKYPVFSPKYQLLLPIIHRILKIHNDSQYIVAHWRRGDQLELRCDNKITGNERISMLKYNRKKEDRSVNCGSVDDFVHVVKKTIKEHVPKSLTPMITYIATNEQNITVLKYLKSQGYKLFADIRAGFERKRRSVNSLDSFVIELMLVCDSTYLFAWGDSGSHNFMYHCRMIDEYKKHITVMDDPASLGHGYHINNYGKRSKGKVKQMD